MGKALVVVAVELEGRRMGRIRLRHVSDASGSSLVGFVSDCVEPGSLVHTDGVTHTAGDSRLAAEEFSHVHLVASLPQRWLAATHQGKVGKVHLQRYLDEFTFRCIAAERRLSYPCRDGPKKGFFRGIYG